LRTKKQLIEALLVSGRELSARIIMFHQAVAQRFELNPTDYKCLDLARHEAGMTPGHLAEITGLTTGAITAVLDRLEHAHFVRRERDESDRRKVIVRVLPGAAKRLGPLFAGLASEMTALHETFTAQELALILEYQSASIAVLERQAKTLRGGQTGL
jgi:DNA-binding MarR family transcriptional regulator